MGTAKLLKTTLVLPRTETQEVVSRLAQFEWFHPLQHASEYINPYYDDLLLKAQRLFQEIDDVVKALGVPLETGVMDTMFKGAPKEQTSYEIEDIQSFIFDLEGRSATHLGEPKRVLLEQAQVSKQLEEYNTIALTLEMAGDLNLDLRIFSKLKIFYAATFIIENNDQDEIKKSLGDLYMQIVKLNEHKSALIVLGSSDNDADRIIKVLRSFGVHPLQVPQNMPQNPHLAYAESKAKIKELEKQSAELSKKIEKLRLSLTTKLLSLHESAQVAKDVLEATRKPGGTKNFATIQGFIPQQMEDKFKSLTSDYYSVLDDSQPSTTLESHSEDHHEKFPTLLRNKKYIRTFEIITETQGLPNYDERDPTPIIAFVWPIFYGLMFADLGHGILLFGLGMLFRYRGNGSLVTWGTLIAASGAAAAIAGLGTGELFGFHAIELPILAPIAEQLGFVGMLSVSELTFEEVVKILEISIAIGVVHLLLAYFLRLSADIKRHDKLLVFYHDIPTIVQYFAVVSLILAAIGSGYDIIGMFGITGVTHDEPVPWLTVVFGDWVTVELVAKVAPLVIIGAVITMIIGGMKEEKHLKKLGKDEGGGLVGIVVEVIMVRIIEMLSNTISYSRLGIMLLVHAALLVTVIDSFESLGGTAGGYAVLIGGNIGIMLIEGLIVYIQTIRLHLYEWFPKWYIGEGSDFKRLVPKMLYSRFVWHTRAIDHSLDHKRLEVQRNKRREQVIGSP
ncbi:MAG TPA: V-type ATPase 116kDa subunit family protein [Nitrososphaeraceae archaeon]|jgi:V/A-type H+-transporting ATPase subunit I|nr:V-type ATPase 116kDa subunit family protein [Nitrososphaeraceae archaeon]